MCDADNYRVPNGTVLTGYVGGIGILLYKYGIGLTGHFIARSLLVLVCFLPFYVMRKLGAGDIKLLAMVSLYYQSRHILQVYLYTFLLGAVLYEGLYLTNGYLKRRSAGGLLERKSRYALSCCNHSLDINIDIPMAIPLFLVVGCTVVVNSSGANYFLF